MKYVQSQSLGAAIEVLSHGSPDDYETFFRRETTNASNPEEKRRIYEIKTLRNLRPCVGQDMLLRIDGRLENADLPTDAKYPIILPARHALMRLINLSAHALACWTCWTFLYANEHSPTILDNSWDRKHKALFFRLRKMLNTKN